MRFIWSPEGVDEGDAQVLGDVSGLDVLEIGCGAAQCARWLVSVGARALTGQAYKGHVFWDTEIYLLPFYVYTHPTTARALLMYRYHTLPGARAKAARTPAGR